MAVVIAVASDQHARSTVGLCSPKGVAFNDGGHYQPSKGQLWMWDIWEECWDRVGDLAAKHNAPVWWINNGDLVDGDHHNTPQIVSRSTIQEREIVRDILDVPLLRVKPESIFIVRGTASHVGQEGSSEESIARALSDDWPVEWCPEPHQASWYTLMLECEGLFIDALHHGRTGYRAHTSQNATELLAWDISMERAKNGERLPDIAFRSHIHRYFISAEDQAPVRVIQTPAFQLKTGWAYGKVPESLADVGMVWVLVDGDHYEVHKHKFRPNRGPVWTPTRTLAPL